MLFGGVVVLLAADGKPVLRLQERYDIVTGYGVAGGSGAYSQLQSQVRVGIM